MIPLSEGGGNMGERLFDLDLQLVADSILMIVAIIFIAIIVIGIPLLIINLIRMIKRKKQL